MKTMIVAFVIAALITIIASGVLSGFGMTTSNQMSGDAVRLDEVEK